MKKTSPYLVTSIKGIPIIIKCKTHKDIKKFSVKGSFTIGKGAMNQNLSNGRWVNDGIDDSIAEMINDVVGNEYDCWIQKEDAQHDTLLE